MLDTSFTSATNDGFGDKRIEFDCSNGGVYSTFFQKKDTNGYLLLAVIQNGKLLNERSTTAAYGVVVLEDIVTRTEANSPLFPFFIYVLN